jgi:hypothetical protein|tara:strand:- start:498 stop:776 length:279 start_codon:yes stop_codon:yes gene_type:complete
MSKQQKYKNYIVEDLVSKTKIDYGQEEINFPFLTSNNPLFDFLPYTHFSLYSTSPLKYFSNYVKERYGASDQEIEMIWDMYRERIQSLINNE